MEMIAPCLCGSLCLGGENAARGVHHRDAEIPQSHRRWRSLRPTLVLLVLLAASCFSQGQSKRNDRPQSDAGSVHATEKKAADAIRYSWEFAQPQFVVRHIVVEHDVFGRG